MKKILLSGIAAVALFASANVMAQNVPTKAKQEVKTEARKADIKLGEAKHAAKTESKELKYETKKDAKATKSDAKKLGNTVKTDTKKIIDTHPKK